MTWEIDWAWSLPLIVIDTVTHVLGLMLIYAFVIRAMGKIAGRSQFRLAFLFYISVAVLLMTLLHAFQAVTWAATYLFLDALPDKRSAMLYSLNAITSFGHANLFLKDRWQLMGTLESLNGILLFGLTTAFLYAMVQDAWAAKSEKRKGG